MKLLVASDIHGSALWCERLLEAFRREGAERLVLLGDLLYHGPRNDLPEGYAPKKVVEQLSAVRERLLCVRGNCDAEVDQLVLPFPILADYAVLFWEGRSVYVTHGHVWSADNPPPLAPNDILLCGHTHVPAVEERDGFLCWNPGSVSIPKAGSERSYMTVTGRLAEWKTLDGTVFMQRTL